MIYRVDPGQNRLASLCEAGPFADKMPINHPVISPLQAPASMMARLPPILLIIGGAEPLLGENLEFAQRATKAGAPAVRVSVYEAMWHDFIQYSEGCRSGQPLGEGVAAIRELGRFLASHNGNKSRSGGLAGLSVGRYISIFVLEDPCC